VIITGVGGQGQVLASRLIGAAAIEAGLSARTGETIGMAQRGGSVVSNVRIGDSAMSPSVPFGHADLIIGFELCEAARVLPRLASGGSVILHDHTISPITVSLGLQGYDRAAMLGYIEKYAAHLLIIDAAGIARAAGSEKAANVVLLGAALGAGFLPLSREAMLRAIEGTVPPRFLPLNLKAFESGYNFAKEHTR